MIHKFEVANYSWHGVTRDIYKEDDTFKDVTRQVLFDAYADVPCQFRYFEVGVGGFTTLEQHEHIHVVIIFRGKGQMLLGEEIYDVSFGDSITIKEHQAHQFRANQGEPLGFFCLVNAVRDAAYATEDEEVERLKQNPYIAKFLET